MSTKYPKSPNEKTQNGMVYFPRMLDKIRLHARGELPPEYHKNMGAPMTADGACCNFLRVNYADLRERVLQGGSDDEILEWCYEKGRPLNEGDIVVWNGLGRGVATWLSRRRRSLGIGYRAACREISGCRARSNRIRPLGQTVIELSRQHIR